MSSNRRVEPIAENHERFSDFFVTVNTHQPFTSTLADRVATVLYFEMNGNKPLADRLCNLPAGSVTASNVTEVGIEPMPFRRQKLHAHFLWEVKHSNELYMGKLASTDGSSLNVRLQEYFDEAFALQGCYVRCTLLRDRSKSKNYALKGGGQDHTLLPDLHFDFYT